MLSYISKKKFETNSQVRSVINDVLAYFDNHILYDVEQNGYVAINCNNNSLSVNLI